MSDQKQRPETILDDPSLAVKAKKQDGMEGEPTLKAAVYENNPRLVVRTRVPNDRNNGKIEAAMSNRAFFSVLRALEEVANHQGPTKIFMDNQGHRFVDKKRDPNPSIMSCICIEKLENGVVGITISAGNKRPLIPFYFIDCTYHQWRGADGNKMSIGEGSRLYALGWIDMIRKYVPIVIADHYQKPAWMTRNQGGGGNFGGNGGGNWNNNGGGNGGGNNWQNRNGGGGGQGGGFGSQPSNQTNDFNFDDDIPI